MSDKLFQLELLIDSTPQLMVHLVRAFQIDIDAWSPHYSAEGQLQFHQLQIYKVFKKNKW